MGQHLVCSGQSRGIEGLSEITEQAGSAGMSGSTPSGGLSPAMCGATCHVQLHCEHETQLVSRSRWEQESLELGEEILWAPFKNILPQEVF